MKDFVLKLNSNSYNYFSLFLLLITPTKLAFKNEQLHKNVKEK